MKQRNILLIIFFIMLVGLTACSKGTKDSEIKENIETELESVLDTDEDITDIVILEKEFDKKDSDGLVQSKIISEKDKIQYVRYYNFVYDYDKEDGWEIETFVVANEDKWDVIPLAGIDESKISQILSGENITIDGELWSVNENNISDISVVSHNTSLDENKDVVVVSFTIDDYVMRASGELTLNLVFDTEWKLDTTEGEDTFSAVEKMECVHNVTEDELIDEIILYELTYGGSEDEIFSYYSTEQVISMNMSEISDFVINSEESTSKGTINTYNCSFLLSKLNVLFDVNAIITYEYVTVGVWSLVDISFVASVNTLDMVGDWIGTYNGTPDQGECVLSIDTVDENGNITGIYNYYPFEQNNVFQPGSFYVTGNINKDNLCISLIPGEWIEKPQWSTLTMNISLQLMADEAVMYGTGHESSAITLTRDR